LLEENRVLRAVHGTRRPRPTDDQRRRLAVKGQVLGRRRLADIAGIVTPDTILRWYRRLVDRRYDGSNTRRPGRPSTKPDIAALVVRMATENPTWGSTRIRGGLKRLGHDVARTTIKAILKDHGIAPVPERGTKTPWKTDLCRTNYKKPALGCQRMSGCSRASYRWTASIRCRIGAFRQGHTEISFAGRVSRWNTSSASCFRTSNKER
jgi:Homeodomain-like domain